MERKVGGLPEMIQNIYREMVNIKPTVFPPTVADKSDTAVQDLKPPKSSEQEIAEEHSEPNQVGDRPGGKVGSSPEKDFQQKKQRKNATGIQRLMRSFSHDVATGTQEDTKSDLPPPKPPTNQIKPKTSLSMKKDILSSLRAEDHSGLHHWPCFPAVMLQIKENQLTEQNVEKHQALFLLALKCDRHRVRELL